MPLGILLSFNKQSSGEMAMKALSAIATAIFAISSSFPMNVKAEIYRNIQPSSTLEELKKQFPGATFQEVKAAWTSKSEFLYEVKGPGLPGTMVVKMNDYSFYFQEYIKDKKPEDIDDWQRKMAITNDSSKSTEWVRFIPDYPIPVERLISKYGLAEKTGYREDDFQPYKSWPSKGVHVTLSDDSKKVLQIDYTFTQKERCDSYKAKFGTPMESCSSDKK